jgi:hypothetical protein
MLSRGEIGVPHDGHADGGDTTDSRRGTRWMTTFRNDPTISPNTAHSATITPRTVRETAGPVGPAALCWDRLDQVQEVVAASATHSRFESTAASVAAEHDLVTPPLVDVMA